MHLMNEYMIQWALRRGRFGERYLVDDRPARLRRPVPKPGESR